MSGRLVEAVLDYAPRTLRPGARMVLLALASAARDSDMIARYDCSVSALARRTCMAEGSVRNAIGQLVASGLIVPLLTAGPGRHQEYRLIQLGPHHRDVDVSLHSDALPPLRIIRE